MSGDLKNLADKRSIWNKIPVWLVYSKIMVFVIICGWLYFYILNNWNDWSFTFFGYSWYSQNNSYSFSGMFFFIVLGLFLASIPGLKTTFLFENHTRNRVSKFGHLLVLFLPSLLAVMWQWNKDHGAPAYCAIIVDSISASLFILFGCLVAGLVNKFGLFVSNKLERLEKQKYDEFPESDIEKDIVGINALVSDISEELNNGNSVSLTGPYGSGKSTVVYHVKKHFIENEDIGFALIGLWGLQTENAVNAIVSGILQAAENKGVDTITVRNLPSAIASSISPAHWTLALGCSFLRLGNETASHMLKHCDCLLAANSLRVIICLEDIERCSTKMDAAVINDLLDILKQMNCVSLFITYVEGSDGANAANPKFIRERICNTHRLMPKMRNGKVWARINDLRAECFQICKQNNDILEDRCDLITDLKKVTLEDAPVQEAHSECVGAVVHLLSTPRTLKRVFKRIEDSWRKYLHGEVAFWDLLLMTTLREINENIFGHVADDRQLFVRGSISCNKEELAQKFKTFEDNPLIYKLLRPILPFLSSADYDSKVMTHKMFARAERDYMSVMDDLEMFWPRIFEMRVPDDQLSIQEVLKESCSLIKDDNKQLVERIQEDTRYASIIGKYLRPHVNEDELKKFLTSLLETYIEQAKLGKTSFGQEWSNTCPLWGWNNNAGSAVTIFLDKLFPEFCDIAVDLVDMLYAKKGLDCVMSIAQEVFNKLPSTDNELLTLLREVNGQKGIIELTTFIRKLRGASSYRFDDIYGRFVELLCFYDPKNEYEDRVLALVIHLTYYEIKVSESISYEPVAHNFLTVAEVDSLLSRLEKWHKSTKSNHVSSGQELAKKLLGNLLNSPKNLKTWKSRLTIVPVEEEESGNDKQE